jgi:hypothetical protein
MFENHIFFYVPIGEKVIFNFDLVHLDIIQILLSKYTMSRPSGVLGKN